MPKLPATRRKPGPAPTGKSPVIGLRLPAQLIAALENWAKKNRLSRSEAVRRAIELMLASEGKAKR